MKSGWLSHAVAAGTFLTANAVSGEEFLGGNGGFELGDLGSWTVVSGGGWDVVEFDHPGKSGRFYVTTCNEIWPGEGGCKNGNGERDTGVLTSAVFIAPGGYLEFRISGSTARRATTASATSRSEEPPTTRSFAKSCFPARTPSSCTAGVSRICPGKRSTSG